MPLSVVLGAYWYPGTRPWLVGGSLAWQGCGVQFGQVRGLCLNPRTCMPLRESFIVVSTLCLCLSCCLLLV